MQHDSVKVIFHSDTELLLGDGNSKKIIDIEVGDIIAGLMHPTVVLKKYHSSQNLYRIVTRYGNSFIVGENNQFLIFNNTNRLFEQIDVKQFECLTNLQKSVLSIYKTGINFEERATTPFNIDPYYIGILIGNTHKFVIKFNCEDDVFMKIEVLETLDILKLKHYVINGQEIVIFISKIFIEDDIKDKYDFIFGETKYLPDVYKKNSLRIRHRILAGILDINSVQKSNYTEIRNLEKKLAKEIYGILFSVGIFHVILVKESHLYNIKIYGNIDQIPYNKTNLVSSHIICNNFKVAPIIEKDCFVLEFDSLTSVVLSDFTVI